MSQKNLSVRLASRTQVFPEKSSETIVTEASQCAVQPIKSRKRTFVLFIYSILVRPSEI